MDGTWVDPSKNLGLLGLGRGAMAASGSGADAMALKRERVPGEIESFLRRMYSDHGQLERTLGKMERHSCLTFDDFKSSTKDKVRGTIFPSLFSVALALECGYEPICRYFLDVSAEMQLSYSISEVKLLPASKIESLPSAYSPMSEKIDYDEAELDDRVFDEEGADHVVQDDDYMIVEPPDGGDFKLRMLDYEGSLALNAIWGKESKPRILERRCYEDLWKFLNDTWHVERKMSSFLLLGVPGVGKTAFLIYMLSKLMSLRKTVVLQTKNGKRYLYRPGDAAGDPYLCYQLMNDFDTILLDYEVYFLVDGKLPEPPLFCGRAFVACKPFEPNYKEYIKDGRVTKIYLPVWSAEEIGLAWQEVFNVQEGVQQRYQEWGGTARFVLERTDQKLADIFDGVANLQKTVEAVGNLMAEGEHPSHKLVHMQIDAGYRSYSYMFASPHIRDWAIKKLQQSQEGQLRLFLSFKGLAAHGLNGLKGGVLQTIFKNKAKGVLKLNVREVPGDGEAEEQVFDFGEPTSGFKDVKTFQVPPQRCNTMFWPSSPVQSTFDAFRVAREAHQNEDILEMFQVTISSGPREHGLKYGLKYAGALELMKKLGIPAKRTKVYIVTTSELFPEAGFQDWRRSRDLVLKDKGILKQLQGIRQYVLDSGF